VAALQPKSHLFLACEAQHSSLPTDPRVADRRVEIDEVDLGLAIRRCGCDDSVDVSAVASADRLSARREHPGFVGSDLGQRRPEHVGVVEPDRGQYRELVPARDDVRRVQQSADPGFDDVVVGGAIEDPECDRVGDLEERRSPEARLLNTLDLWTYSVELVDQDVSGDGTAVDLEALDELVGVGGQMRAHPKAVCGQDRGDERAHRSLPRRARQVHSGD